MPADLSSVGSLDFDRDSAISSVQDSASVDSDEPDCHLSLVAPAITASSLLLRNFTRLLSGGGQRFPAENQTDSSVPGLAEQKATLQSVQDVLEGKSVAFSLGCVLHINSCYAETV